jgi:hypothetical protein
VQSRKPKPEQNISEAAEKTGLLIRGLQSRLLEGDGGVQRHSGDATEDLEQQLQQYFACSSGEELQVTSHLNWLRNRVIDGVADRIMRGWQQSGKAHPFEGEVIERLIDGVLETLMHNGDGLGRKPRSIATGQKTATTQ